MDPSFLKLFYSDMKDMGFYNELINKSIQLPEIKEYEEWDIPTGIYEPPVPATQTMQLLGKLQGHSKPIKCIRAGFKDTNTIISGSSDKTITVWTVDSDAMKAYGDIKSQFTQHHDTISDITISADEKYAMSSSMDGALKLWEISENECTREFTGAHTKGIIAVVFSPDNRKILTIGKDNVIAVWNTIGVIMMTDKLSNNEWFSCMTASPDENNEVYITGGNDVKFWVCDHELRHDGGKKGEHKNGISAITISPDGSLVASGGVNGLICMWAVNEEKVLCSLKAGCGAHRINDVVFPPTKYWVCCAVSNVVEIWDLETRTSVAVLTDNSGYLKLKKSISMCISWSVNGSLLYSGHNDNMIRIWKVNEETIEDVIEQQYVSEDVYPQEMVMQQQQQYVPDYDLQEMPMQEW
eukprot:424355_1